MMQKRQRYPRLTPLRALELLRELDFNAGKTTGKGNVTPYSEDRARSELANHVRAALARSRVR